MDTRSPLPVRSLLKSHRFAPRAFSLVEVAMSIGIVAFAFVAILGLLPTGMATFRASIDRSNEGRIMQVLTSRIQATEFRNLPEEIDFASSSRTPTFFFDEEGTFIAESSAGLKDLEDADKTKAIYAAKVFFEQGWATGTQATDPLAIRGNTEAKHNSKTALVLMASIFSAGFKQFEEEIDTLQSLQRAMQGTGPNKLRPEIRVRALLVPKMDPFDPTATTPAAPSAATP